MYIKLDQEVYKSCEDEESLKAARAELSIYKCNRKVEYSPAGSIITSIYKVKNKPKDDIKNGIKWLECKNLLR